MLTIENLLIVNIVYMFYNDKYVSNLKNVGIVCICKTFKRWSALIKKISPPPLEVVSGYCDSHPQVGEKYSYLLNKENKIASSNV